MQNKVVFYAVVLIESEVMHYLGMPTVALLSLHNNTQYLMKLRVCIS